MLWPVQIRLDAHILPLRYRSSPFWKLLASSPHSHVRPKEITLKPAFQRARVRYHCSRAPPKDQSPSILICREGRHLPRERHTLPPPRAKMYPEIEPYQRGRLEVDGHSLYYELVGNKNGKPAVFLHGGPGGGCLVRDRSFFDPKKYHVILFDQRGSGRSTPTASLDKNTTWDLVGDIERLRKHLNIEKWLVFGGSWGSTLSLAYAETHPERVTELILRGIFTLRKSELQWFYQEGASHIFPEAWEEYLEPIPENERHDLMTAYHKRLNSDDEKTRLVAAKAWSKWEMSTSRLHVDPNYVARATEDSWANAFARIENHYFVHEGFMREGQLLEKQSIDRIRHIPCVIIQGRYDVVCPVTTAWALKKAWPEVDLRIVPDAGHSAGEPGISAGLVEATDKFAQGG